MLEDFKDDKANDVEGLLSWSIEQLAFNQRLKPTLRLEDFTWEAKGVRAGKDAGTMSVFPQDGTFNTIAGKEGEVNFPIPYAVAPNVELSGNQAGVVIIVECRPTGFKWKNGGDHNVTHSGTVTWKARGIRATEVPKPKPQ